MEQDYDLPDPEEAEFDADDEPSIDDVLEESRRGSSARGIDPLEEDGDSPAAPAVDTSKQITIDHPQFDANIDPHELYDEGISGSADIDAQDETDEPKKRALYS